MSTRLCLNPLRFGTLSKALAKLCRMTSTWPLLHMERSLLYCCDELAFTGSSGSKTMLVVSEYPVPVKMVVSNS